MVNGCFEKTQGWAKFSNDSLSEICIFGTGKVDRNSPVEKQTKQKQSKCLLGFAAAKTVALQQGKGSIHCQDN